MRLKYLYFTAFALIYIIVACDNNGDSPHENGDIIQILPEPDSYNIDGLTIKYQEWDALQMVLLDMQQNNTEFLTTINIDSIKYYNYLYAVQYIYLDENEYAAEMKGYGIHCQPGPPREIFIYVEGDAQWVNHFDSINSTFDNSPLDSLIERFNLEIEYLVKDDLFDHYRIKASCWEMYNIYAISHLIEKIEGITEAHPIELSEINQNITGTHTDDGVELIYSRLNYSHQLKENWKFLVNYDGNVSFIESWDETLH